MDAVTRALDGLLGRCAALVPPARRGWAEAVRAEAGEVPAGAARAGWLAGGLWLVAREAGMVRRIAYGLGIVAVAAIAALVMRYLWSAAHAGRFAGWDKARVVWLVALLAGLPWVARARGVFGPPGRSVAARTVRVGGATALLVLVLDLARVEHFPEPAMFGVLNPPAGAWSWPREAVALTLIGACLAAVLTVPVRWPKVRPVLVAWGAAAAALALYFTLAPVQVLLTVYVAGIFAATAQRSPVVPATLAMSAGIGLAGGLLIAVLWDPLRSPPAPGLTPRTDVPLLFMLLVGVIVAGTGVAGAVGARRAGDKSDPLARKARGWQYLAAGPLTAAAAALPLPLVRASHAVHFAATCPPTGHLGHCTAAPAVWMFFLVIGPVLGLGFGTFAAFIPEAAPQPPRQPPPDPPDEPDRPRPDGSLSAGVFVKI